jgi:hypothetical protein
MASAILDSHSVGPESVLMVGPFAASAHPRRLGDGELVNTADAEASAAMPGCGEPPELADDDESSQRGDRHARGLECSTLWAGPHVPGFPRQHMEGTGSRVAIIGTGARRPGRT